jgi:hypothetical protein
LTSLSQKLAILGPPELVAEMPADREAARATFSACGWKLANRLTDWRRPAARESTASGMREALAPVSYDDLVAAGLLETGLRCWQRDLPALAKHSERLSGLAFHSPDRIEAWALWDEAGTLWSAGAAPGPFGRIGLAAVLDEINAPLLLPRAAPEELDADLLAELGFERGDEHLLFTSHAQAA